MNEINYERYEIFRYIAYKLSKLNCSVNTTLKIREQFQSCINTNTWGKGRTR